MSKAPTRVRILKVAFGADGKPTMWRGIVMSGAKVVASTGNMRNEAACLCIAETLCATYNATQLILLKHERSLPFN